MMTNQLKGLENTKSNLSKKYFYLLEVCCRLDKNVFIHGLSFFTRECNETSIAGGEKALARSLDFVNYFIYGNYNVS